MARVSLASVLRRLSAAPTRSPGGGLISRGHLYKILSNPIYVGRLAHKGQVYDGQHAAIIDAETWVRVQGLLASHTHLRRGPARAAEAWLAGKLYDDRDSRMSPSEASRGGRRWRYYVSQAILQGRKHDAGSIARVAAPEVESRVLEGVEGLLKADDASRFEIAPEQRAHDRCMIIDDVQRDPRPDSLAEPRRPSTSPHMGCFQSSSFISALCMLLWRLDPKREPVFAMQP